MDVTRVVLFCLVALVGSNFGYEFDGGDDAVDCDAIMKNERLVNGVVECLMADGDECGSVLFSQIKKYAPEILETTCGLCTDKQKEKFKSCTNKFIKIRPADYEAIIKKMDPDNKYRPALEAFLAS